MRGGENRYIQVRILTSTKNRSWPLQDIQPIIQMLKGPAAQQAGILYLQDEKHELKVHEEGKLWSVYGSPVSTLGLASQHFFSILTNTNFSGLLNSSIGHSVMNEKERKVSQYFLEALLLTELFRTYLPIPQDRYYLSFFLSYKIQPFFLSRLTHGPAHQIFDRTMGGDMVGCEALGAHLPELRPRLHVAGHVHEARGACVHK